MQSETLAPDAALFIILARLEELRERRGVAWCRDKGVGPIRARIGRLLPPGVVELPASRNPDLVAYVRAQEVAQRVLRAACVACGGCELAKR